MRAIIEYEDYKQSVKLAIEAAESYYNSDISILDDYSYDQLIYSIMVYEKENPSKIIAHKIFTEVAAGVGNKNDVLHTTPMLSLDNVFNIQELDKWFDKFSNDTLYTIESKFDGLSLSAIYNDGKLVRISTRGDGSVGEDVSFSINKFVNLPSIIPNKDNLEIRGEVIFTKDNFILANQERINVGMNPYANARNAASGALRTEKSEYHVNLSFVAHGVIGLETKSHFLSMNTLKNYGFTIGDNNFLIKECNRVDIIKEVNNLEVIRDNLIYEIDGAVIKLSKYTDQDKYGYTSKSPRWAIAYKYKPNEVFGKIKSIEIQIGRQGTITPVAKINPPVNVGGVRISSVTLHNFDEIKRKDIRINDTVTIHRAGEVIPEIIGVVYNLRDSKSIQFIPPSICPNCGSKIDKTQKRWLCTNIDSCAKLPSLIYAFSRDALDIEGLGEKVVKNLYENGLLYNIEDIYKLDYTTLSKLPRFGDKSITKLIKNIEDSKNKGFASFITALGISQTGKELSKRIAERFIDYNKLINSTLDELTKIEGIGYDRALAILNDINRVKDTLKNLNDQGVNLSYSNNSLVSNKFKDNIITITGSHDTLSREDIKTFIINNNGKFTTSINKKCNLLLVGNNPSESKLKFAEKNNIKTENLSKFIEKYK